MQKKVLLTTAVYERPVEMIFPDEKGEYRDPLFSPAFGVRLIKENVPGIDILEYPTWDEYQQRLSTDYDVVAISFCIFKAPVAFEMTKVAREYGVKEVWAGGYGTMIPNLNDYFDRVLKGHGESALSMALYNKTINKIKHPSLITKTNSPLFKDKTGYLFVVRGCNMGCQFCSTPYFTPQKLYTPLSEIKRVLDEYKRQGVDLIWIMDDNFFIDDDYAWKVIKLLSDRNFRWMCNPRCEKLIGKVEKLRQHGLAIVYIGIESFSEETLKDFKKGETVSEILQTIKELKDNDVAVVGTYILCMPNATLDSTRKEIEQLASLELYGTVPTIFTTYPGTPPFNKMKSLIFGWNWRHYDNGHIVWKHPHIKPDQARMLMKECFAACNCPKMESFKESEF